jgi:hypothetical protein
MLLDETLMPINLPLNEKVEKEYSASKRVE